MHGEFTTVKRVQYTHGRPESFEAVKVHLQILFPLWLKLANVGECLIKLSLEGDHHNHLNGRESKNGTTCADL